MPIFIYQYKNLSINFVTGLPILTNQKSIRYNLILIIVDWLTKMIYYELVIITINASSLAKVIINIVVRHHSLSDSIITYQGLLFSLKFWSVLYYFSGIKQRPLTAFYPQIDIQTKRQNNIMKTYL